jgi:hypothetical protein
MLSEQKQSLADLDLAAAQGQRGLVVRDLRRHPRLVSQGLLADPAEVEALIAELPVLIPFRGASYHHILSILDWDHRLPSRSLLLRLHAQYDAAAAEIGEEAYQERLAEISTRDRFPEFDVPDFSELPASESYLAQFTAALELESTRLLSPWRRQIATKDSREALRVVRESEAFAALVGPSRRRSPLLGELEAVSWTPPCESEHSRWTLDVWLLLAFDGHFGQGRSFLVDLTEKKVVRDREFMVRSG